MRVGIVGARRLRQGLGPFVARELARQGAEVPAFLASSEASLAPGAAELEAVLGHRPHGFTDFAAMVQRSSLDAAAILSPSPTHGDYLEAALAAGIHVFCEKPLLWNEEGASCAERAGRIVSGFARKNLVLYENCQWPETLPTFEKLHPSSLDRAPRQFAMVLCPLMLGRKGIGDALPHPLSLLQALAPSEEARVRNAVFTERPQAMSVQFAYATSPEGREIQVEIELKLSASVPREAAYAVDGRWARRLVRGKEYAQSLSSDSGVLDLPDPLGLSIQRFLQALETARATGQTALERARRAQILQRVELLDSLVAAYEERER